MLKFVVVVVIALAKGEKRHEQAVARRALARIGLLADPMAKRVDAKGHVVHEDDASRSRDQEGAECRLPSAPEIAEQYRQPEAHAESKLHIVFMLPDSQAIFLQIANPGQRTIRSRSKKKPSDMGMEEPSGDIMRVIFMIGKLVVPAVIGTPAQSGSFKSSSTKLEREELHRPFRLEGQMGK